MPHAYLNISTMMQNVFTHQVHIHLMNKNACIMITLKVQITTLETQVFTFQTHQKVKIALTLVLYSYNKSFLVSRLQNDLHMGINGYLDPHTEGVGSNLGNIVHIWSTFRHRQCSKLSMFVMGFNNLTSPIVFT